MCSLAWLILITTNHIIVSLTQEQTFFSSFDNLLTRGQTHYSFQPKIDRSDHESQAQNYVSHYSSDNIYTSFDQLNDSNNDHGNVGDFGPEKEDQDDDAQTSNHDLSDQQQLSDYPSFGETDYRTRGVRNYPDFYDHQRANYVQSVPLTEHVEVTRPAAVPVYKEIGIPVVQPFKISLSHPVAVGLPQPYPIPVPVPHAVPVKVVRTVPVPVERKVPFPIEKHIPVPVDKYVPYAIEKHIPVPVYEPYPIKVPFYKTIYHYRRG
uniref:Uncharacterized protein n=1 Tax=Trichogramma kaykai TaxID=54128 RepID=A0ABD2X7B5_9HYME